MVGLIAALVFSMIMVLSLVVPAMVNAQGPAGSGAVIIMSGSNDEPKPPNPPEPSAFDNAPPVDFSDPMVWGFVAGVIIIPTTIYMIVDIRRQSKKVNVDND